MSKLIPIKYHFRKYDYDIYPKIQEVSAHFDKSQISFSMDYSLHTEYSHSRRKFSNHIISKYKEITDSNEQGIPKLWTSNKWSIEFADFIKDIVGNRTPPKIIEIHPPYRDTINNMKDFIKRYSIFEEKILEEYPNVKIFIENRCGTLYKKSDFLFHKYSDFINLSNELDKSSLVLQMVLDVPQLFSAHAISKSKVDGMEEILIGLKSCRHNIEAIHLWGKKLTKGKYRYYKKPHIGDLNSYFNYHIDIKKKFLNLLFNLLDDGKVRYIVPEVNSNDDDLNSIICDLIENGFEFI